MQTTALLPGNTFRSVIVSQTVYDVYDMSNLTSIPGYMTPLVDNVSYLNLQTLFLNTFGNGDLTNGYSYTFNVSPSALGFNSNSIPLAIANTTGWQVNPISVQLVDCAFTVAITTNDYQLPSSEEYTKPITWDTPSHVILQQITTNPFPSGALLINKTIPTNSTTNQYLNSFRFTLTVPSAIDNRKPDDTMFLHGAMTIPTGSGQLTPAYLVCQLTIVYSLSIPLAINPTDPNTSTGPVTQHSPIQNPQKKVEQGNTPLVPSNSGVEPVTNTSKLGIPQLLTPSTQPAQGTLGRPLYDLIGGGISGLMKEINDNQVSLTSSELTQLISIINTYNSLIKQNFLYGDQWSALQKQWRNFVMNNPNLENN